MGRVHRRTVIKGLAATAATAALGACTATRAPGAPRTPPSPSQSPSSHPPPSRSAPDQPGAGESGAGGPGTAQSGQAGPVPVGRAPTGTFAVRTQQLSLARGKDRPLPTTIWRPAAGGPYPLILFSHGLNAVPEDYAELLTAWARAGFVVAAPSYPYTAGTTADFNPIDVLNQPLDASHVITEVARRGGVDAQRIAAGGHSAGGVTTLGMFSARRDTRLRSGVILAGRQVIAAPLTGPAAPLLFVHGKRDRTVDYADGHAVYDAVTWPKAFLTFPAGGHVAEGAELDVIAAASTDFWRWTLYGDQAAKARIPRDATRGGLGTLANRL
ncbi:alpha/beta hydrolase family protein [Actinoplanes sp. NPDC051513]|uniref:alpha/beta hydrolase family protein n=1 Tax=Actinoplanes sp. NPDC051513 TaxID=3363908 RepID=UPI00379206F2